MDRGDGRPAGDDRAASRRRRASPPLFERSRQEDVPRDELLAEIERQRAEEELEQWRRRADLELLDLESEVRHRHEMRAQTEFDGTIRLLRKLVVTALMLAALVVLLIYGPGGPGIAQLLAR